MNAQLFRFRPLRNVLSLVILSLIASPVQANEITPSVTTGTQLVDVNQDLYKQEIQQAVEKGLMSGFPQQQFRPQQALTREQLVSVVIELFYKVPLENTNIPFPTGQIPTLPELPTTVEKNPFPDVDANRWSAAKIQLAREIGFIRGYKDGLFRPDQAVTRAELMAMLWSVDRYTNELRKWDGREFFGTPEPTNFSDISRHWAKDTILKMSSNCQAASPLNETGNAFAPDQPAKRNYVAAATVRTLTCLSIFPPNPS
ncbi:MAG: S-layer homology domain-containing protein [Lyngbya sp.]|nr:S-layer homology domain-containing protein [Lyngbya sp.]